MASNMRPPLQDAIYHYKQEGPDLLEKLQELLDDGCDINEPQPGLQRTPLYFACGHIEKCGNKTIQFLIEHGANPLLADGNNQLPLQRYLSEKRLSPTDVQGFCNVLNLFGMREHCDNLVRSGECDKILEYLGLSYWKGAKVDADNVGAGNVAEFLEKITGKIQNVLDIAELLRNNSGYFSRLFNPEEPKTEVEQQFLTNLSQIIPLDKFRQDHVTAQTFTGGGEMLGVELGVTVTLEKELRDNANLFQFFVKNMPVMQEMSSKDDARPSFP